MSGAVTGSYLGDSVFWVIALAGVGWIIGVLYRLVRHGSWRGRQ